MPKKYLRFLYEVDENKALFEELEDAKTELYRKIKETQSQWKSAKNLFNNSTDPDQIDYAICLLELYEKKLKILYKKAKELE